MIQVFELIDRLMYIAKNCKTRYMWGTFGNEITPALIAAKAAQYPEHYSSARKSLLSSLTGQKVWAFDCAGLIKGVLWGFCENGGGSVSYCSHGVPDLSASGIIGKCSGVSSAVSEKIPAGAALYMPGHIGIYLGGGKVVEATLSSRGDGVVISSLHDVKWQKYGLLPWVDYTAGKVDAEKLWQYLAKWDIPKEDWFDVDGDGKITARDAVILSRKEAGLSSGTIHAGSTVRVRTGAKIYGQNGTFAPFVYETCWIVSEISGDRAVIDKSADGQYSICSPVRLSDLIAAGSNG